MDTTWLFTKHIFHFGSQQSCYKEVVMYHYLPAHHEIHNLVIILLFRHISANIWECFIQNREEHVNDDEGYGHHKQEDKDLKQKKRLFTTIIILSIGTEW